MDVKEKYLSAIRQGLSDLPMNEVKERISFYSEMIDDRVEDGLTVDEAIREIGPVTSVVRQVIAELGGKEQGEKKEKEKAPRTKRGAGYIALVISSSVIWLPLLIVGAAALASVYVSLWSIVVSLWVAAWSVVVSLWAAFVSLIGASLYAVAAGVATLVMDKDIYGALLIGAAIVMAGLSILIFFAARALSKAVARATAWSAVAIARLTAGILRRK